LLIKISIEIQARKKFTDRIKSALDELPKDGQLLLQFDDHGGYVSRKNYKPESVGYTVANKNGDDEKLSLKEIQKALVGKTKNKKLKIIAAHCLSGSAHHLSHNLPNTCSIAPTSPQASAFSLKKVNYFTKGVHGEIAAKGKDKKYDFDKDGKSNLLEAYFSGMELYANNLHGNDTQGMPSSFDFIDKAMGTGFYRKGILTNWEKMRDIKKELPHEVATAIDSRGWDVCRVTGDFVSLHLKIIQKAKDLFPILKRVKDKNFNNALVPKIEDDVIKEKLALLSK